MKLDISSRDPEVRTAAKRWKDRSVMKGVLVRMHVWVRVAVTVPSACINSPI